jgi:hypothetical protein
VTPDSHFVVRLQDITATVAAAFRSNEVTRGPIARDKFAEQLRAVHLIDPSQQPFVYVCVFLCECVRVRVCVCSSRPPCPLFPLARANRVACRPRLGAAPAILFPPRITRPRQYSRPPTRPPAHPYCFGYLFDLFCVAFSVRYYIISPANGGVDDSRNYFCALQDLGPVAEDGRHDELNALLVGPRAAARAVAVCMDAKVPPTGLSAYERGPHAGVPAETLCCRGKVGAWMGAAAAAAAAAAEIGGFLVLRGAWLGERAGASACGRL